MPSPESPAPNERAWRLAAMLSALALAASIVVYAPFIVDDAYITYRYSANLAAGHGLTFNPGLPPVEGYANAALVVAAALLIEAGLDPVPVVKVACAAFALLCVPLTYALARRLGARPPAAAAACWLLSLSAGFGFWAVGGLETTLAALLLLAGVLLLLRERTGTDVAAGAVFALAALARFEAPVFAAVAGALRLASDLRRGEGFPRAVARSLPWAATFAVLYGSYFLFRWSYFGVLLPNPVYAKAASGVRDWGGSVAVEFLQGWWPFLAAGALSPLAKGRASALPLLMALAATAGFANAQRYFAESVSAMSFFDRYFVPILPFLAVAAALGLDVLAGASGRRRALAAALAAGLALWELANPAVNPKLAWRKMRANSGVLRPMQAELAGALRAAVGDRGSAALGDVGYVGYLFPGTVVDLYGLTSYDFTRTAGRDIPRYMDLVLERAPDAIVLVYTLADGPPPRLYQYPDYVMQTRPAFKANYRKTRTIGQDASPRAYYVIFERAPEGAAPADVP